MSRDEHTNEYVDTETGEVMTSEQATAAGTGTVVIPTQVTKGSDLARIPQSLAELASIFAQDEPSDLEVAQWILEPDQMAETDPEESTRAILARILSAQTAEEVLATQDVIHAQDIIGEGINATGVKWQRSEHQQSSSCYAVITGQRIADQSNVVVTCGARQVMMMLLKLRMLDAFPQRIRIAKKSKPTAAGYYPLFLEPA